MAQGNGGIIGPVNVTSKGKDTISTFTSSGTVTTQPGTKLVDTLIVAGGGSGARVNGGGGAGGALLSQSNPVTGNTPYTITVGGGGAASRYINQIEAGTLGPLSTGLQTRNEIAEILGDAVETPTGGIDPLKLFNPSQDRGTPLSVPPGGIQELMPPAKLGQDTGTSLT